MTEQSLRDAVRRMLNADDAAARDVIEAFRQSRSGYGLPTGSDHIHDGIQSVLRMRLPTARFAAHHASHQPATWHYLFDWESPAMRGALGACHALEMPFVFGTLDAPTQDRFAGSGPEATRLIAQMLGAWATFARTGSPVVEGADAWPAFDDAARQTMILGRSCHVTNDPFVLERQAVEAWV